MPLVINSVRSTHTHTHAHTHTHTQTHTHTHTDVRTEETRHALAFGRHVPGLKILNL